MQPIIIEIKPSGLSPFPIQVVGESRYKENLLNICGDYDAESGFDDDTLAAELVMEDDNPIEPGIAIAVRMSPGFGEEDLKIGYLSKQDATAYRQRVIDLGYTGQVIGVCGACIKGGFEKHEEIANFGVRLDFIPGNFEVANVSAETLAASEKTAQSPKANQPPASAEKSQRLPNPPLIPVKGSGCLYYGLIFPFVLIIDFYILVFWLLWVIILVIWRFFSATPQRQKIGAILLALIVLASIISAIAQATIK